MVVSSYTHSLGPLSEADCWSLFKRVAFSRMREDDHDKFEDIGKAISKKCNGNPLGTKVLASLMCLKRTEQEWRDVLASHIWDCEEDIGGVLPFILLSYYILPSYLKSCVMYFAVFPKNAIFEKKTLIQLWMAQGYLGSDDDGGADLEKNGRDYFDNLLMLSFLQNLERDSKGNITSYRMYDLVHDCVRFISKTDTIVFETEPLSSSVKVLRHSSAQDLNWSSIYQNKKLRTLIRSFSTSPNWNRNGKLALDLLHQLQCLRVLSLQGYQFKELPREVVQLLQLRYLDLSDNSLLEILPETICNLPNLQTLKIKRCKSLRRLPEGIGMLSKLRQVEIEGCEFQPYYSQGCEFRTLDTFIGVVIDAQKNKEGCTFGDLKLLNHLQGHLKIIGLGQVNDVYYAEQFELKKKDKIVSLVLDFGLKQEKEVKMMEKILEALQPHKNLKKLVIKYYQGIKLPKWISSLSNLTVLTLMDLPHLHKAPLGKLPSLDILHLHGLISVQDLRPIYGLKYNCEYLQVVFPKLKKLILSSMPNLKELDLALFDEIRNEFFPKLEELIIRDFIPKLCKIRIDLPPLRKLQGLGKLNCLETLELSRMNGLKRSFKEFMGITMTTRDDTSSEGGGGGRGRAQFPALTNFCLSGMTEWEEGGRPWQEWWDERKGCNNNGIIIMPRLSKLSIHRCPKLKIIPFYLFSDALRELTIQICPQLSGYHPRFPPLLEKLKLEGDVGYLSMSLNPQFNDWSKYTNINYFEISDSSNSSLPLFFELLPSIRQLVFNKCECLHFTADNLKHLTMLEQLKISNCPRLAIRFSQGDISSSSSHSYKIFITPEQQESRE